ncbi:MAG: NAD(P)/FAD-dependent oxidoreductase [Thermoanaerobaculia bacterium]|nr:NAD(P)/FAD-dependent oxidoreductase [Thermoanaerobaculia bacterium]
MRKKVLIIGGGMAGLSAGTYLQMNGFDTEIFELNQVPGGVCTSWKRGDYTVDWCIHWLVGSGSSDSFYERWSELIDMGHIEIVDHEEYAVVEDDDGNQLHLFTDLDRLEAELLEKAPEDEKKSREFVQACRRLCDLNMPNDQPFEMANLWYKMKWTWKMLPYLGVFGKFSRISTEDYARGFKNPLLRKAIAHLFEPEIPILFCMMTFAWMHKKAAGYPIGGSMNFARRIADRYVELGGRFYYGKRVEKILVENNCAVGIQLPGGAVFRGDYVVSAADGHSTLYDMLDGKYLDPKFEEYYNRRKTFPSLVFVALGVGRNFRSTPHSYMFPLKTPFRIDPQTELNDLYIRVHHFDPTLAPYGKTLVSAMMETRNWEYWVNLQRNDADKYAAEKQRIVQTLIDILEDKLGDVRDLVEMTDVTTPATIIGFTNNWKGSFEGWLITPETGFTQLPPTLRGLGNFYMCGHWVAVGGGLPTAMMSGRNTAQLICAHENKRFEVHAGTQPALLS